jgi:hypothetical protein
VNNDEFINMLGKIDDKYITEAIEKKVSKNFIGVKLISAACITALIIIVSVAVYFSGQGNDNRHDIPNDLLISSEMPASTNGMLHSITPDETKSFAPTESATFKPLTPPTAEATESPENPGINGEWGDRNPEHVDGPVADIVPEEPTISVNSTAAPSPSKSPFVNQYYNRHSFEEALNKKHLYYYDFQQPEESLVFKQGVILSSEISVIYDYNTYEVSVTRYSVSASLLADMGGLKKVVIDGKDFYVYVKVYNEFNRVRIVMEDDLINPDERIIINMTEDLYFIMGEDNAISLIKIVP